MPIRQKKQMKLMEAKPFCRLVTKINDETVPDEEIAATDAYQFNLDYHLGFITEFLWQAMHSYQSANREPITYIFPGEKTSTSFI